jgi:hypothetical protein
MPDEYLLRACRRFFVTLRMTKGNYCHCDLAEALYLYEATSKSQGGGDNPHPEIATQARDDQVPLVVILRPFLLSYYVLRLCSG